MNQDVILEIRKLSYNYETGESVRVIFDNVDLSFRKGRFYSLQGESGSGKTTFLSILAALDDRYKGTILYRGQDIRKIGPSRFRRNNVSVVYQDYNLLSELNAIDNIRLAMGITDNVTKTDKDSIIQFLTDMGLEKEKAGRKVARLSGGEQQRVAIARAVMTGSEIILADEPTGNLDTSNSRSVIELFLRLAHDYGKCVIMVTHDETLAAMTDEILIIDQHNGKIVPDK